MCGDVQPFELDALISSVYCVSKITCSPITLISIITEIASNQKCRKIRKISQENKKKTIKESVENINYLIILPLQSSQKHHARNGLDEVPQPLLTDFYQHLRSAAIKILKKM